MNDIQEKFQAELLHSFNVTPQLMKLAPMVWHFYEQTGRAPTYQSDRDIIQGWSGYTRNYAASSGLISQIAYVLYLLVK